MGMRRHISKSEAKDIKTACHNWQIAREEQACAVDCLMDTLDLDADEAVDLLNCHNSGRKLIEHLGIEVHANSLQKMPWVDGETLLVWGVIVVGFALAVGTSGITV
jgi:hypothetical protein